MHKGTVTPQDKIKLLVSSLLLKSEFAGSSENLAAGGTLVNLLENLNAELNSEDLAKDGLLQQLVRLEMRSLERVLDCCPNTHNNALKSIKVGVLPSSLERDSLYPEAQLALAA